MQAGRAGPSGTVASAKASPVHWAQPHAPGSNAHNSAISRPTAGTPFSLTSAYRCPKHNKAVGGVPTSAHTRGYAVDIRCVDSHSRFVILQALLEVGFRRIELAPTWIHVDNDPDKPRDVAFYRHGGAY